MRCRCHAAGRNNRAKIKMFTLATSLRFLAISLLDASSPMLPSGLSCSGFPKANGGAGSGGRGGSRMNGLSRNNTYKAPAFVWKTIHGFQSSRFIKQLEGALSGRTARAALGRWALAAVPPQQHETVVSTVSYECREKKRANEARIEANKTPPQCTLCRMEWIPPGHVTASTFYHKSKQSNPTRTTTIVARDSRTAIERASITHERVCLLKYCRFGALLCPFQPWRALTGLRSAR